MIHANFKEELEARRSIVKWGKELYYNSMVKGSGGNISIKVNDTIILTPTGYFLGHLTEDCLSKIDITGTSDLAKIVGDELSKSSAVLLSNHGLVATGKSVEEAVSIAYEIEENAHLYFVTGGNIKPLSDEVLVNILRKYT